MTELLASEIRRFTSRRLLRLVAALAVLGIVAATVIVAVRSNEVLGAPVDRRFHLTLLTSILGGMSPILVLGGWLLGASSIGAEWHAGTMTTLMIWEPRRLRVIVVKLIACVSLVVVLAIAIQLMLGGGLTLVALMRGTTEGAGSAWGRNTIGVAVRVAALTGMGAALGFAIASVARNTAAALGGRLVYTEIGENLIRGLRPGWAGWLMGDNAVVFITGHSPDLSFDRTVIQAGLLIAGYVALALILAVAIFRTRDVT